VSDFNQFGSAKPPQSGDTQHCAQCEAMLADALDGALSPADQAAFDLHMATCVSCSEMLADAQRGAAWLEMLKSPRPEPSADLLDRIFAQTCNQVSLSSSKQNAISTTWQSNTILSRPTLVSRPSIQTGTMYGSSNVLPFRDRIASSLRLRSIGQTLLQPRLAMTAAMAFFSIALTLNLLGVRLSNLHVSDLRPSSIKRNFYEANAHVTRYYTNLKVVYELESRVRDLQHSNDNDNSYRAIPSQNVTSPTADPEPAEQQKKNGKPATQPTEQKQSRPKPNSGSSRSETSGKNFFLASSSPRQGSFSNTEAFVVFTPSILKYLQEGELV
jgi:hypothetical protein